MPKQLASYRACGRGQTAGQGNPVTVFAGDERLTTALLELRASSRCSSVAKAVPASARPESRAWRVGRFGILVCDEARHESSL